MPQSTAATTTTTEQRSQPWQTMQEVQNLFKPETTVDANTESGAETTNKIEQEPLKLNSMRINLNSATTNIADVEN